MALIMAQERATTHESLNWEKLFPEATRLIARDMPPVVACSSRNTDSRETSSCRLASLSVPHLFPAS